VLIALYSYIAILLHSVKDFLGIVQEGFVLITFGRHVLNQIKTIYLESCC